MILIGKKAVLAELRNVDAAPLHETIAQLKERIERYQTEERELRHMIGLEKRRQEFEIKQAKEETALKVREENLAADKKRFEAEMQFQNDRFTSEVKYLKDMIGEILGRLPTVTVDKKVGASG